MERVRVAEWSASAEYTVVDAATDGGDALAFRSVCLSFFHLFTLTIQTSQSVGRSALH